MGGEIMRGRIKIGTLISQDFMTFRWPHCKVAGAKSPAQWQVKNPDMKFDMEWNGRYWRCITEGFGAKNNYGNGAIFVFGV